MAGNGHKRTLRLINSNPFLARYVVHGLASRNQYQLSVLCRSDHYLGGWVGREAAIYRGLRSVLSTNAHSRDHVHERQLSD